MMQAIVRRSRRLIAHQLVGAIFGHYPIDSSFQRIGVDDSEPAGCLGDGTEVLACGACAPGIVLETAWIDCVNRNIAALCGKQELTDRLPGRVNFWIADDFFERGREALADQE